MLFVFTQLSAITHNAEHGGDHHHGHEICEFVVFSDRLDSGDLACDAEWSIPIASGQINLKPGHQVIVASRDNDGDPRAPPAYT